jgi:hypothetical protein
MMDWHIPATEVVLLFKLGENEVLSATLIILNKHVIGIYHFLYNFAL